MQYFLKKSIEKVIFEEVFDFIVKNKMYCFAGRPYGILLLLHWFKSQTEI